MEAGDWSLRIQGPSGSRLGASVLVEDLNGDGALDLAISGPGANRVFVFWGPLSPGDLSVPGISSGS